MTGSIERKHEIRRVAHASSMFFYGASTLLAVAVAALYSETVTALATQWYNDPDYSHGFLVPALSAYFAWERKDEILKTRITPSMWGAIALVCSLGAFLLGSIGAELFVQRTSLILVITSLVWLVLGTEMVRKLAFPLGFLFFMVPLPAIVMNAIAFPLQLFAAKTATTCLYAIGIPVLREGNVIMLSQTTLEVAEACSGIRSLQALLALGTVYAYFTQTLRWKQVLLVLLSIPIAIAANAFRVSGTGVLAHYIGVKAAQGFYHSFSGLLVFVFAFVLLLAAGAILTRIGRAKSAEATES